MRNTPLHSRGSATWIRLSSIGFRPIRAQDLDGHLLVQGQVARQINDAHASFAEQFLEEAVADPLAQVGCLGTNTHSGNGPLLALHAPRADSPM